MDASYDDYMVSLEQIDVHAEDELTFEMLGYKGHLSVAPWISEC